MNLLPAALLPAALIAACTPPAPEIPSPAPTVTRAEALRASRAYTELAWQGTRGNIRHGNDADGIRIDTPDAVPRACRTNGEGLTPPGNSPDA